jgi:hypothetical protein
MDNTFSVSSRRAQIILNIFGISVVGCSRVPHKVLKRMKEVNAAVALKMASVSTNCHRIFGQVGLANLFHTVKSKFK